MAVERPPEMVPDRVVHRVQQLRLRHDEGGEEEEKGYLGIVFTNLSKHINRKA